MCWICTRPTQSSHMLSFGGRVSCCTAGFSSCLHLPNVGTAVMCHNACPSSMPPAVFRGLWCDQLWAFWADFILICTPQTHLWGGWGCCVGDYEITSEVTREGSTRGAHRDRSAFPQRNDREQGNSEKVAWIGFSWNIKEVHVAKKKYILVLIKLVKRFSRTDIIILSL